MQQRHRHRVDPAARIRESAANFSRAVRYPTGIHNRCPAGIHPQDACRPHRPLPPVKEPFDTLLRAGRDHALDDDLYIHWNTYRASLADAVLKSMLAGIPKTTPALPVL